LGYGAFSSHVIAGAGSSPVNFSVILFEATPQEKMGRAVAELYTSHLGV
jgi:hypothetical protein